MIFKFKYLIIYKIKKNNYSNTIHPKLNTPKPKYQKNTQYNHQAKISSIKNQ